MQAFRNFIDAICYPFRMLARIPSSIISSPRRMLGLSLPVRSALLLFFSLVLIVIVWVIIKSMDEGLQWRVIRDAHLLEIVILVFVIPLVVWYAIKRWIEGEASPFPDIDRVWSSALKAMHEQSIDPSETPIFLILGPSSVESASNFLAASNVQFPVSMPGGPAPMHVFANQQAIYIVCTQSCCLGTLLGGGELDTGPHPVVPPEAYGAGETMMVGSGTEAGNTPLPNSPQPSPVDRLGIGNVQVPGGMGSGGDPMRGTMMIGAEGGGTGAPAPAPARRLDPGQSGEATERLAYLCQCIKRVREPLCPINGVMIATPFKLLADGSQTAVNQLQIALKSDLAALRGATRMRCGVTHVIEGMEEEAGFRELIRRVGTDRAATQRFGKGVGLWNVPTDNLLDAVVRHACGAFEDWSYLLFREDEGLTKRNNRYLYALLCRVRSRFLGRLSHLLQSCYSLERDATSIVNREPHLFSGCYFVASGLTPDRQAFLASVFRKSQLDEEELEWGSEAVAEEDRMQAGVRIFLVMNAVLIAAIIAMVVHRWNQP